MARIVASPAWWELHVAIQVGSRSWNAAPENPPNGLWERLTHPAWTERWRVSAGGTAPATIASFRVTPSSSTVIDLEIGEAKAAIPPDGSAQDQFAWGDRRFRLKLREEILEESGQAIVKFEGRRYEVTVYDYPAELEDLVAVLAAALVVYRLLTQANAGAGGF